MEAEPTAAQALAGTLAREVTWDEVATRLRSLGIDRTGTAVYGVPRGGLCAAACLQHAHVVTAPESADVVLDDIVDSGRTRERYTKQHPRARFVALFDKLGDDKAEPWLVFPWEQGDPSQGPEDAVVRLLQHIGEDVRREGLLDTPTRVVKALREMTAGYGEDPASILQTTFAEHYDEMVVVGPIRFASLCEHHMLPFTGHATVAYVPRSRVVGLSKIPRVFQAFARRLQVQERLTQQVVTAIVDNLDPLGAACVVHGHHSCMCNRGVKAVGAAMVTSAMHGVFRTDKAARAELFALVAANAQ